METNMQKRKMQPPGVVAALVAMSISGLIGSSVASEASDYGLGEKQRIPRTVYWGDTHLHTSFSPDASLTGNVKLDPDEAYAFARGQTITAHNGM